MGLIKITPRQIVDRGDVPCGTVLKCWAYGSVTTWLLRTKKGFWFIKGDKSAPSDLDKGWDSTQLQWDCFVEIDEDQLTPLTEDILWE